MPAPFVSLVLATQVLLAAASGPPKIDVRATCRASQDKLVKLQGQSRRTTFDRCRRRQDDALEQLKTNWASYPAATRARCVQPKSYRPSYVEWLDCLEAERAAGKRTR